MTTPRHILVIDGSAETASVLQAVLEPRGAVVQRKRTQSLTESWGTTGAPDVVVVDVDDIRKETTGEADPWQNTPQVVIGSTRVSIEDQQTRFLQKPFQFPELIRAIEDLLPPPVAA